MTSQLKIISKAEGFRRAGFSFGKVPVILNVETLTSEQINALKAEPYLVISEIMDENKQLDTVQPAKIKGKK